MPASIVMADLVRRLKAEGRDVVDLTWGAPHVSPPASLLNSVSRLISDASRHSYGPGRGELSLRRAIAEDLHQRRGLVFDPSSEILVVPGGKMGAYLALNCLLEAGDEVLIPEPYWLSYPEMVSRVGGVPVPVRSFAERRFVSDPDELARSCSARTRGLILNTPNNPSGYMLSDEDLQAWASILTRMDFVICDEVYETITFDRRPHRSPLGDPGLRNHCLLINSFSKSLAVPGWRLGYLAGPREWLDRVLELLLQTMTCMPSFLQEAVAENLAPCHDYMGGNARIYEEARDFLHGQLDGRSGFHLHRAEGAFYMLMRCEAIPDGDVLARRLLEEREIGTVPGSAYGESTRGWVRLCFARPRAELEKALARLELWKT